MALPLDYQGSHRVAEGAAGFYIWFFMSLRIKKHTKKAASTLLLPGGRTLVSPVGVRHNVSVVATSKALAGAHAGAYESMNAHVYILKGESFFHPTQQY